MADDSGVVTGNCQAEVKSDDHTQKAIPVCTLFNDTTIDSDHPAADQMRNVTASSHPPKPIVIQTDVMGEEQVVKSPTLCDIFQTDTSPSPVDDIFSHLGDEHDRADMAQLTESHDLSRKTIVPVATMESLRLSHSVDSFDIGELSENETLPVDASDSDAPKLSDFAKPEHPTAPPTEGEASTEPLMTSPSFVSINSFSVSLDDQNIPDNADVTDQLASEVEKLTLDGPPTGGLENDAQPLDTATTGQLDRDSDVLINGTTRAVPDESPPNTEKEGGTGAAPANLGMAKTHEGKEDVFEEQPADTGLTDIMDSAVVFPEGMMGDQGVTDVSTSASTLFADNPDNSGMFAPATDKREMFADDDDPFAAALSNSELDRRRDAWLPSETTKTVLMAVLASQRAIKLEPDKLTNPGLSTSELLEDPVKELVVRMTGSESIVKRENLTMDDVPASKDGIKRLVDTGNLRSAANLCARQLTDLGQGFGQATQATTNTPDTIQLWYGRIGILTKLKQFEMAATELSPFRDLDNPDLYFEFYPDTYPGRRGSMVPFSFRLLHAEFPRHVDKPQESLKRLHKILGVCNQILQNLSSGKSEVGELMELNSADLDASVKQWTERKTNTLFCVGNTLMQLKDYALAVDVYDRILKLQPKKTVEIESGIGRIYLHLGDVRAAQQRFTKAEKAGSNLAQYKVQLILNRGFMYIGTNNWKDAFTQFEQALQLEPHNIVALNNKAVCMLYLGRLKDAISVLEAGTCDQNTEQWKSKVTDVNWQQTMTQGLLGNLSTLYELESSRYVLKKRALFLKQIAPTCGDSFDTVCFKEI